MEGLKVRKLLFGSSFFSVQKVTLGILGCAAADPVRPSLPCCFRLAKGAFSEGLKVQKLLFGASFLSVQKVTLGILGCKAAGPIRHSLPCCFRLAKGAFSEGVDACVLAAW